MIHYFTTSPTRKGLAASLHSKAEGFTLIELLVVMSIIAILASLAFPAVQGALGSSKKAQARNDVSQLVSAIKAFQLEYGRLPSATSGSDAMDADGKAVLEALTITNDLNPRGIVFFEPKQAKGNKGGKGSDGKYHDPWGIAYKFSLDTSYDNRLTINGTQFATVVVESAGPDKNLSTTNDNISNIK